MEKRKASGWHRCRSAPGRVWRALSALLVLLAVSLAVANVAADSNDERRIRAGARLFRSLLAAEVGIERRADSDGQLRVLLLGGDARGREEVTRLLLPAGEPAAIRGLKLQISGASTLPTEAGTLVAVFLVGPPAGGELEPLLQWANERQVLVFSPFEGHVERGAHAGLAIEAKVQPHVNEAALKRSGIVLKPFFLRVAKVHR